MRERLETDLSVMDFNARASNVIPAALVMKNIITPARIRHALCTSCNRNFPMPRPRIGDALVRGNPVTVIYVTTLFPNSLWMPHGNRDILIKNSIRASYLSYIRSIRLYPYSGGNVASKGTLFPRPRGH